MIKRRLFMKSAIALTGSGLVWPMAGTAQAGPPVALNCSGAGNGALRAALCTRLHTALSGRYPGTAFVAGPAPDSDDTVTLHLHRVTSTALIAHLSWNGGAAGRGPVVTAGTRDKTIGPREYDMLIKALLKLSDLPL